MTTAHRPESAEGWISVFEEDLAGQRARLTELLQSAERDRRELAATQERLRETEALALRAVSQTAAMSARLDEIQTLRERFGRFQSTLDEHAERLDLALRQLRHEVEAEREALTQAVRRLDAVDQTVGEAAERLTAIDETLRRQADTDDDLSQRIAQAESHVEAGDARIAANAEAIRRAHADQRAADARDELHDRRLTELTERFNAAQQSLLRVRETADQWEDLMAAVEGMRARADDARRMLDEATATAASVRREFETMEERIGDIERGAEQLRSRDSHRERALALLSDELERLRSESSREQQRFVALQEQIRRRQINDLEQEIRELKAYVRVQADD